jgi:hypothetical protein
MAFYQQEISPSHMTRILTGYHNEEIWDGLSYIRRNIIDRRPERGPCKYYEIMGNLNIFRGLREIEDRVYEVRLGVLLEDSFI